MIIMIQIIFIFSFIKIKDVMIFILQYYLKMIKKNTIFIYMIFVKVIMIIVMKLILKYIKIITEKLKVILHLKLLLISINIG